MVTMIINSIHTFNEKFFYSKQAAEVKGQHEVSAKFELKFWEVSLHAKVANCY